MDIFQKFESLEVLVVGDVMLDRYLTGKVSRVSPEAPVPVLEWGGEENRLGGAANVALNVQALGAKAWLCGVVGQDSESACFFELLPGSGLDDQGIVASKERSTTVKTRVIAGNQHLLRLDKESKHDLSAKEQETFLRRVIDLMNARQFHAVILQDYNKGVLSKPVIHALLAEASRQQIPVAVDPKFRHFWEYRGVELFKPNLKEVCDALHLPVKPEAKALQQAARLLREKLNNHITLITLSEKGAFVDDGQQNLLCPTQPRNVADVCGAGDTVISVAALAMAVGLPVEEIASLANLAGGQVVEKVGVVAVDKEQLRQEMVSLKLTG